MADTPARARMTALGDCASILHRHIRNAMRRPDWEARHAILQPVLDDIAALLHGFTIAATPINLLWAFVGCALGTAIGVLPGIGPAVTVAMLLPITAQVEPTASMIFFAGIYYGAMYGGSTTSILLNTPGESATIVTALDGYQMARQGRAGAALGMAAMGSFIAGTLSLVVIFVPVSFMSSISGRFLYQFGITAEAVAAAVRRVAAT